MRYYSSVAAETTLAAPCSGPATTIVVAATTGYPVSFPFTLCLDAETVNKELVEVTAAAGTSLTVTRGVDGTSAVAHTLGATVSHDHSARDFRESREHEAATVAHGLTGSIVGTIDTQVVTHKDLTDASNTFPASLATDTEVASAISTEVTNRNTAIGVETAARIAADAGKAALVHTHAESDVTGLVADLAAKAPVSTTVTLTTAQAVTHKDLTDATNTFPSSLATDAEVTSAIAAVPAWTAYTPTLYSGWDTPSEMYYKDHGRGVYTVHGVVQRAAAASVLTANATGNIADDGVVHFPAPLSFTTSFGGASDRQSVKLVRKAAGAWTAAWDAMLQGGSPGGDLYIFAGPPGATISPGDVLKFEFTAAL